MRAEIKYLVSNARLEELRQVIAPFVTLDKYGKPFENTGYTVRSIYLDTPRLVYYREKIEGLKKRKKLRIRGYNKPADSHNVFLEIKRKEESRIAKIRTPVPYSRLQDFLQRTPKESLAEMLEGDEQAITSASKFMYHLHRSNLQCINLVVYEREAYEGKINPSLRVTFDKNLRTQLCNELEQLYDESDMQFVLTDHFILEIKYNNQFPAWLTPILSNLGLQKQALSKYCMSLEKSTGLRGQELLLSLNARVLGNRSETSPRTE